MYSGIVGRAYMKCVVKKNRKNATKKTEIYLIIQQKVPVNGRLRASGLARSSKHAFEFLLLYILRCACLYVPHPERNAPVGNDDNVVFVVGWIIMTWLVDSDILHYSIGEACRERGFACMTNLSFEVGRQPDRHIRRWSLNLQAKSASRKVSTNFESGGT